jgi:Protein of unknown function (DUF2505)
MTTTFRFEHDFRAPSIEKVFRSYFDPELSAEHDRLGGIVKRDILEQHDTPERLVTVYKAVPERQWPVFVRPFVSGPIFYTERMVWERAQDRIDLDIRPSVMSNRARIRIAYVLTQTGPDTVHRVYEGDASVDVALVGRRAERTVIDDIESVLGTVVPCTQRWLDTHP